PPVALRRETGHPGQKAVDAKLLSDYWGISYPPDIPAPASVPPGGAERSALALAFRANRECGFGLEPARLGVRTCRASEPAPRPFRRTPAGRSPSHRRGIGSGARLAPPPPRAPRRRRSRG